MIGGGGMVLGFKKKMISKELETSIPHPFKPPPTNVLMEKRVVDAKYIALKRCLILYISRHQR